MDHKPDLASNRLYHFQKRGIDSLGDAYRKAGMKPDSMDVRDEPDFLKQII